MSSSISEARKDRFKRFTHFFSGLLILMHGYERFDGGHAMWPVFILAGITFITLAILHGPLAKKWPAVDGVFFVIEGCLSFVIMGEFLHAGKSGLPYMYLFAGLAQFFAAWIAWRRKRVAIKH